MLSLLACVSPDRRRDEMVRGTFLESDTNAVISLREMPTSLQVVSEKSGKTIFPGIDIYADGRCSIRRWNGTEFEHQISKETLAELLRKLQESGFFGLSTAEIDEALRREESRQGRMRSRGHQPVTKVVARTLTRTNSVEQYGIDWKLKTYPQVKEVGAFFDCMRHIHEAAGETEHHVWRMREQQVRGVGESER
jgi:hypothetical protein